MKFNKQIYYAILSGVLLGLSFPPFPFFPLAFIAFIPLFVSFELNYSSKIFLRSYLTFFTFCGLTNWWIGSWQSNTDPFLMASGIALSIVHPFFFLIPIYIYIFYRKKIGFKLSILLFPLIWTSFEWLHSLGEFSYPWLTIGYTQIYNYYFVQIADIFGVWGISFIITTINSLLFLLLKEISEKNISSPIFIFKNKYLIITIALFIIPYVYGIIRVNTLIPKQENKHLDIGIIQPNINPWLKWQYNVYDQILTHIYLQDSLIQHKKNLDIIIWSETAIPYMDLYSNSIHNFPILEKWIRKNKTSILTGFADIYLYKENEKLPVTAKKIGNSKKFYSSYNAAILINKNIKDKQIYHKMKLTPFSERIPYVETFTFLKDWIQWGVGISSWEIGKEQKNLILNKDTTKIKIAPIICIESIYPKFVSEFANLGADFYVIITNDAWYNYTFGPEQHFIIARMRAIESRRFIARCANSGISGFISNTGEPYDLLPQYIQNAKSSKIYLSQSKTIYMIFGDILPLISTLVIIILLILTFFYKMKQTD